LTESLAIQKEQAYQEKERQADVCGHQAFLMSSVPALNGTPLHVTMEAGLKIAEVVNASHQRSCMNSEDFNITDYILLQNAVQNN